MSSRGLLFAAVAMVAAGLPLSPAGAVVAKDIRDWSVTCTNGLTCTMSFADWTSKELQSIRFRRSDAPNAAVDLLLSAPPGFDATKGDTGGVYAFEIDGKAVLSAPLSAMQVEGVRADLVYGDQKAIRSLLDAMKSGASMEIVYKGTLGTFRLPVKLSGVKGSLVFLDETQDRLQRTDALDAVGDRQPPTETMAMDILSVEDLPESIRHDFTDEGGACAELDDEIGKLGGFSVTVDGVRWIVAPCGTGGAYNFPYALYVSYDVITERISFPDVRENEPTALSTAFNIDFDPKTKIFTSFSRGRGIGDCGFWTKWKIAKGGSPALVLVEERRKDDCDENDMGGPQNFPLVWPQKQQ